MALKDVEFGFMGTSLDRLASQLTEVESSASFIELQIHDKLKHNLQLIPDLPSPAPHMYYTIHGEGETDGIKKIKLCSRNSDERKKYIQECIQLYTLVSELFPANCIKRLILHPDSIDRRATREDQISLLASSLTELADKLSNIESICIEPRGTTRHGKVLRINLEDLYTLKQELTSNGSKIGLCIDIAQLFIIYGNEGAHIFLKKLSSLPIAVREFHISDVAQDKSVMNRVGMEVGKGSINWSLLMPLILNFNRSLLIETLGGAKVYYRSKSFFESLMKNEKILL